MYILYIYMYILYIYVCVCVFVFVSVYRLIYSISQTVNIFIAIHVTFFKT